MSYNVHLHPICDATLTPVDALLQAHRIEELRTGAEVPYRRKFDIVMAQSRLGLTEYRQNITHE